MQRESGHLQDDLEERSSLLSMWAASAFTVHRTSKRCHVSRDDS
jgi:hypothetical protein